MVKVQIASLLQTQPSCLQVEVEVVIKQKQKKFVTCMHAVYLACVWSITCREEVVIGLVTVLQLLLLMGKI